MVTVDKTVRAENIWTFLASRQSVLWEEKPEEQTTTKNLGTQSTANSVKILFV